MIRKPITASAFPSLQASMNFGQYGCSGLTPDIEAARLSAPVHTGGAEKATPARARGFGVYLSGRVERI